MAEEYHEMIHMLPHMMIVMVVCFERDNVCGAHSFKRLKFRAISIFKCRCLILAKKTTAHLQVMVYGELSSQLNRFSHLRTMSSRTGVLSYLRAI
ncbi:hypothetical protein KIN20_012503 [Parelaphostrongylus tenuis]|uniref:Uncharacterized protein n=1 Tax=Parelaphostrongylus tenuis TaxID=148309 RepID=A0AAD5MEA4_PARTN|nr:hypothetical protein KIN20_012503 [Parelaphostrongylus tenuis]